MGKVELQKQIRALANEAGVVGGCLVVESSDGTFDLIGAEDVQLLSDHVEAHDLDGAKVQIPYTMIAAVTVGLP
jgi:hypothetical protein